MRFCFSKYQGAGNDFVLINDLESRFPDKDYRLISKICNRRFGIGADGLMLLRASKDKDFTMIYFNADGYEGTMCGNGGRCIVAFARDSACVDKNQNIVFDAIDGEHSAEILSSGNISLKMINVEKPVETLGGYHVETGSTHHVEYCEDLVDKDVNKYGCLIRNHNVYSPQGCNVNFIEDLGKGHLAIRTFERGVEAETLACGTGSVAAAIVHHHEGHIYDKYQIKARGGDLVVSFDFKEGIYKDVFLEGPAHCVFTGEYEI